MASFNPEKIIYEYRERQVFTNKLRFVAFAGFWLIYLYFMRDVLGQTKNIMIIVSFAFIITFVAYRTMTKGISLVISAAIQILCDLTAITAIIYLTGGPYSSYYTAYLFYVFVAGIMYNHYIGAVVACSTIVYYLFFLVLCHTGFIYPLIIDYGDHLPVPTYTPFAHFIFAVVFLGVIVYTVKVASVFSQRRERALEKANHVKSEFLATMSHELRTPLTAIIGFSELLVEGVMGDITDGQKDSLKEVLHNSADLLDLINSLLDLTKIESGKMKLDIQRFDLSETMHRIANTITPLVRKKNQNLELSFSEGEVVISGDEKKIQQTVLNLVANANKFTSEGGCIRVMYKKLTSHDILSNPDFMNRLGDLKGNFKDGGVEIIVADDGIGIQADHFERIFEMFHQVDSSATRNFGGTGVGLSLAKKFIELHGGCIWVESEFGRGAKFTVALPINH